MAAPVWIRQKAGVPSEADFAYTAGQGSPLVINTLTGIAYYLDETGVVRSLATGGGGGGGSVDDMLAVQVQLT